MESAYTLRRVALAGFAFVVAVLVWVDYASTAQSGYNLTPSDPWRPGCRTRAWQVITAIQRYPLYDSNEPNWVGLARDEDAYVRAAVALAIGRMREPVAATLLNGLINDDAYLVRQCAFWALTQVKDPCIKEPLVKVLSSWDSLLDDRVPDRNLVSRDSLFAFFDEVTLPTDVLRMSLSERRAWLERVGISEWTPTFYDPTLHPPWMGDRWTVISMCIERSHWDAGDDVATRFKVHWTHPERATDARIDGDGTWRAINVIGEVSSDDERRQRCHVARGPIRLEPNQSACVDDRLAMQEALDPGVYLFVFRGQRRPHACYLARVQRAESYEPTIRGLLEDGDKVDVIESLGRNRVRAAVPQLVAMFRENGAKRDNGSNMKIAEALGRIGDPEAVPALLEYPFMRHLDLVADTFRTLTEIGPSAYPYCERHVLEWKVTLDAYVKTARESRRLLERGLQNTEVRQMFGLEMAIRTLGPHGSDEAVAARLGLVRTLTSQFHEGLHEHDLLLIIVYRAAVLAFAARQPDEVVKAIWETRDREDVSRELLKELRQGDLAGAEPICVALWELLRTTPDVSGEFRDSLERTVRRVAPDILSGSPASKTPK